MTVSPLLTLTGIEKFYTMGEERVPVLKGVDLTVDDGEFIIIRGPAGSGKSALLNIMAGIEKCSAGSMTVGGLPIEGGDHDESLVGAFVSFLSPVFSLDTTMTIQQAVTQPGLVARLNPALALAMAGVRESDNRCIQELDHDTRRRVGTARALVSRPRLILADMSPPPWGVAPPLEALLDANEELGCAVIATTTNELQVCSSRTLDLVAGRIVTPSFARS